MKLEPVIQSEVSQKEKHKYSILTHIYGIQKDGNDNPVCETAKDKYHLIPFIYGVLKSYTDKFIYKTEVDSQTQKANLWLPKGRRGEG